MRSLAAACLILIATPAFADTCGEVGDRFVTAVHDTSDLLAQVGAHAVDWPSVRFDTDANRVAYTVVADAQTALTNSLPDYLAAVEASNALVAQCRTGAIQAYDTPATTQLEAAITAAATVASPAQAYLEAYAKLPRQ